MNLPLVLTLAAVFTAVALVVGMGLSWALSSGTAERRRLRAVTRAPAAQTRALPEIIHLSTPTEAGPLEQLGRLLR